MRLAIPILCLWMAAFTGSSTGAQETAPADEPPTEPVPTDLVEEEQVRLVILDVLVLDRKDRTVPDLTLDDFELVIDGKPTEPDTLDVDCSTSLEDARAVRRADKRTAPEVDGDSPHRIVLAFDYLHLPGPMRTEVLDYAMEMLEGPGVAGEEVMIVALNGGLRVEQIFTGDRQEAWASLRRMQRDITLWQPSFFHLSERGWVRGMTTMFDLLGTYPGPKAVVYFSAMGDVPMDIQFSEIAAQAAATRCSVYPVDARGLAPPEMETSIDAPSRGDSGGGASSGFG